MSTTLFSYTRKTTSICCTNDIILLGIRFKNERTLQNSFDVYIRASRVADDGILK